MKMKCVNNSGAEDLTVGEIYEVNNWSTSIFPLCSAIDDRGISGGYYSDRFVKIEEDLNKTQIKNLLIAAIHCGAIGEVTKYSAMLSQLLTDEKNIEVETQRLKDEAEKAIADTFKNVKIGQIWKWTHSCGGEYYIVSRCDYDTLSLISIDSGNRWKEPVKQLSDIFYDRKDEWKFVTNRLSKTKLDTILDLK